VITFGDAAIASNLIGKYTHVALYSGDCTYPCPADVADAWEPANKRWITFTGTAAASIIDYEAHTKAFSTNGVLKAWLKARKDAKMQRPAWIYCDLSNAAKAVEWAEGLPFHWWLATLDGISRSPAELSSLLRDHGLTEAESKADLIDAQQVETVSSTDRSLCFGNW
jgi:hypothetical protein